MKKLVFFFLILVLGAYAQEMGAKYLIVTHDNFYNDVQPLAQWKHKKGMRTKVVTLSQIGSTAAEIKSYITTAYNTWPERPEYILIVGAPNFVPWGSNNSDNYYGDMSGNLLHEILPGRLTVHNSTEAQNVMNKILLYERTPDMTDSTWFTDACLVFRLDYDAYDDSIYRSDIHHAENLMRAYGYGTVDTLSQQNGSNASTVIQRVNEGRAFVLYRGQGVGNWWGPFDVNPDATANGNRLPIVLSITCSTIGTGSSPATAEKWLLTGTTTSPRGGAGYFATTTVLSGAAQIRSATCKGFFNALFTDRKRTFGEACEGGRRNVYNLYGSTGEYQGFKTLGDPEMNVWTAIPKPLEVTHAASIAVNDDSLLVTVTMNSQPLDSALVCILLDTTVYHWGYTDGTGEIVFALANLHPGQMDITVTARNAIPYESTIAVVADNNPYLTYLGNIINDSLANDNGVPENGETILLNTWLKNIGLAQADGVTGVLRSSDSMISIIDSTAYFGSLPPQDSSCGLNPYVFSISPDCPAGHVVNFELLISDVMSETWLVDFSIGITNVRGKPSGPDAYGYYMYDNSDSLYGYAPTFNWFEIAPPGPGAIVSAITDEDADTVNVGLPFTFKFYGINYDSIGLCSNGFVELGSSTYRFGDNDSIPLAGGPKRLVAPFWDDLDPRPTEGYGDIYTYYDTANHRWIIEYKDCAHYGSSATRETFQAQLLDPIYYPTPTGDGEIVFLYNKVSDATNSTVGIENSTETIGLQYIYNDIYDEFAAPIDSGRAVLITTNVPSPPLSTPWLHTVTFTINDSVGGNNNGIIDPNETIDIYVEIANSGDTTAYSVSGILSSIDPDAEIIDSTATIGDIAVGASATNYGSPFTVHISATPYDTTIGFALAMSCNNGTYQTDDYFTLFVYGAPGIEEQKLAVLDKIVLSVYPNPFKGQLAIQVVGLHQIQSFLTPGEIELNIYDVCGRTVKSFANPTDDKIIWNGLDDQGRRIASGVYFVDLNVAGDRQNRKVVLLK